MLVNISIVTVLYFTEHFSQKLNKKKKKRNSQLTSLFQKPSINLQLYTSTLNFWYYKIILVYTRLKIKCYNQTLS